MGGEGLAWGQTQSGGGYGGNMGLDAEWWGGDAGCMQPDAELRECGTAGGSSGCHVKAFPPALSWETVVAQGGG